MEQLGGFVEYKTKICLLNKYLYGCKQSPRQWYRQFEEFFLKHSFVRNNHDNYVNILKRNEKVIIYLILYDDDTLMASSRKNEIVKLKEILNDEFEMKDLDEAKIIGGMNIMRSRKKSELFLSKSS